MKPTSFFIGSLPYKTPEEAIAFVHKYSSHLPFLPQLPESNENEDMIGQVLRGIELGHWDETASSCLELFQNDFADAPRCKIQIAGPLTVARSMTTAVENVIPQWFKFWEGLKTQLRQGAFRGELWLQLDEPFWSQQVPLPQSYFRFLEKVRNSRSHLKLGIHSCATTRPEIHKDVIELSDFFSFDFVRTKLSEAEIEQWLEVLANGKTMLVVGVVTKKDKNPKVPFYNEYPNQVLLSATCGLNDWTSNEIEAVYR